MAKVKNLTLAEGDEPEPRAREIGEEQVVAAADRLVANTAEEAGQLVGLYGAEPDRVVTIPPGVDLDVFTPGSRASARRSLGLPPDAHVLLFVGRVQPLKAPDVLLRATAELLAADPTRQIVVAVVGGPSGSGLVHPHHLESLAQQLGIAGSVRLVPPVAQRELADWYRAADLTVVPSYSESFGLVAVESQACGTPVIAAAVGGLRTAVDDGESGVLVDGHDPRVWAREIGSLLDDEPYRARLGKGGLVHADAFSWQRTAGDLVSVYADALVAAAAPPRAVAAGGR